MLDESLYKLTILFSTQTLTRYSFIDPKMPHIGNQEAFKGEIYHSSMLDGKTAQGKKVLIVGGGASAVEALEFVVNTGAAKTSVLGRFLWSSFRLLVVSPLPAREEALT